MDFLATPDTVTGTAGSATPGAPTRVGLLTDGTSPNDASKNWAKYYNMLLEEMRHIIVTFGGAPDDDNWHQAGIALMAKFQEEVAARYDADVLINADVADIYSKIGTVSPTDLQTQINNINSSYPKLIAAGAFNGRTMAFTAWGSSGWVLTEAGTSDGKYILTPPMGFVLDETKHSIGLNAFSSTTTGAGGWFQGYIVGAVIQLIPQYAGGGGASYSSLGSWQVFQHKA